jgi:hypothetical protein
VPELPYFSNIQAKPFSFFNFIVKGNEPGGKRSDCVCENRTYRELLVPNGDHIDVDDDPFAAKSGKAFEEARE